MRVATLDLKPAVSVAAVLRVVRSTLKIPAWSVVLFVAMAGLYGYVEGRQKPLHHYVPYVGYPLVLDTTTGKSCYSTDPKPAGDTVASATATDGDGQDAPVPVGPTIPVCGK